MRYELWDTENRNLFYGADTLNEILRAARQALKEGWAREALAIGTDDGSDEPTGWPLRAKRSPTAQLECSSWHSLSSSATAAVIATRSPFTNVSHCLRISSSSVLVLASSNRLCVRYVRW